MATKPCPNITIFSGISGIDKAKFLKKFVNKSKKQNQVFQINFEKELLNEERNPPESSSDMPTFLNSDDEKLSDALKLKKQYYVTLIPKHLAEKAGIYGNEIYFDLILEKNKLSLTGFGKGK